MEICIKTSSPADVLRGSSLQAGTRDEPQRTSAGEAISRQRNAKFQLKVSEKSVLFSGDHHHSFTLAQIITRCQYWHFRGMLWPHLFPLYASHIFKAILLRYGVHEIIPEISF